MYIASMFNFKVKLLFQYIYFLVTLSMLLRAPIHYRPSVAHCGASVASRLQTTDRQRAATGG